MIGVYLVKGDSTGHGLPFGTRVHSFDHREHDGEWVDFFKVRGKGSEVQMDRADLGLADSIHLVNGCGITADQGAVTRDPYLVYCQECRKVMGS